MTLPFINLFPVHNALKGEMQTTFEAVYDDNWFIQGNRLEQFESEYAAFNHIRHAVGVSNGLDALVLALKVLGIGPGDEVIVPSNTYIASVLAVSHVGATPVFAEPAIRTCNIDPERIIAAITSRTKAIMPVHLYGQACEMDTITAIAEAHNLYVVEDNAQAHGAAFKGKLTGAWGKISATSFYPGKNLGALGDGGAVTTDSDALAEQVRLLRNYGSAIKYQNEVLGHNMRLDELQAAFLSVKLKRLSEWTAQRQQIAAWYSQALQDIGDLILPFTHPNATHVFHLYVIRTQQRDALQQYLQKAGIGTLIHYPIPPHLQKAYAHLGLQEGDLPIAEELARTSLSLPLWVGIEEDQINHICKLIIRFFETR